MKHKNLFNCYFKFTVLVIVLFISINSTKCLAQKIVPEVKTILHMLPLEKQEWLQDFHERVQIYIRSKDWHDQNFGGEIKINMEFLLQDISTSSEERYRTNLLISNGHDIQYFDKRCRFKYRHGEQVSSDNLEQTSLTNLIDYYVYLILGGEFDKYGTLAGSVFFERTKDIAQQAKFDLGRFIDGWDLRSNLIERILNDDNKPYREMVDYFYYSLSLVGEDDNKAREYCAGAVDMIVEILTADPKHDACLKFLDVHRREIINLFKNTTNAETLFEKLAEADPDHADAYRIKD